MLKMQLVLLAAVFFSLSSLADVRSPVVLIHGANFSGRSWTPVIHFLVPDRIPTLAPDLYSANEHVDLQQASQRLCALLSHVDQPVVLVGHSQGGAIITEAAAHCASYVKSLIYVAAVLPLPGEGTFDDLSQADADNYGACGVLDQASNTYTLKGFASCWKAFMADSPLDRAEFGYTTMVPEAPEIGNSKADYSMAAISSLPKYYVGTAQDLIISQQTQLKIMHKVNFDKVFVLQSSHTPFFSMPQKLASLISLLD